MRGLADKIESLLEIPFMTDPWRVAVHEARHAVAGRLMGLRCGAAIIVEPFAKAVFDCDCGEGSKR